MIKYIKWFLLTILITGLIILGIKFVNYDKFKMSSIYNMEWYKKGIAIYEGDELFSENHELTSIYYMTFTKDKVNYCNSLTNECDKYSYSYKKGIMTVDAEDYFIPKGTYNINYNDEGLELSIKDNEITTKYYFTTPLG